MHPDRATGVIYKAGDQVPTLTTNENGQASVDGLYLGNYYVKEITPPTGYIKFILIYFPFIIINITYIYIHKSYG